MKKLALLIMALALSLAFMGCADDEPISSGNNSSGVVSSTAISSDNKNGGENDSIEPFTSFIYSGSNDAAGIIADAPVFASETIVKTGVNKNSVTFLENEYALTYLFSDSSYTRYGILDNYRTAEGYTVILKEETQELISIVFTTADGFYEDEAKKKDSENPRENAITVAKDLAGKYISINDYECEVSEKANSDGVTYYTVELMKYANGITTMDYVVE